MIIPTIFSLTSLLALSSAYCIHDKRFEPSQLIKRTSGKELPKFGYTGERGPLGWWNLNVANNSACSHGTQQSPINIDDNAPTTLLDTPEKKPKLNYPSVPNAKFENLGTTVEVEAEGELTLPDEEGTYELAQFHFHTPSEHRLFEEYYTLEMHMVHKRKGEDLLDPPDG